MPLTDNFGRSIHDLRISITDRCNYKCVYCRTGTNGAAYAELPFEDYLRMARILVGLGITKIRLTGGEPLLRKGIVEFVRDLAKLRTTAGKKPEVALTTNGHLLAGIAQPLEEIAHERSETARRYRFSDGVGEFGIIAPVSHPFCGHCSRIRITSDGKLRTCLFSVWDHDLHELMRRGATDEKLAEFIVKVVEKKEERHHIGEPGFAPASRTMVHIGG